MRTFHFALPYDNPEEHYDRARLICTGLPLKFKQRFILDRVVPSVLTPASLGFADSAGKLVPTSSQYRLQHSPKARTKMRSVGLEDSVVLQEQILVDRSTLVPVLLLCANFGLPCRPIPVATTLIGRLRNLKLVHDLVHELQSMKMSERSVRVFWL